MLPAPGRLNVINTFWLPSSLGQFCIQRESALRLRPKAPCTPSIRRYLSMTWITPVAGVMTGWYLLLWCIGILGWKEAWVNLYHSSISLILYPLVADAMSSNPILQLQARKQMLLRASPYCGRSRGWTRTSTRTLRRRFFRCIQNLKSYLRLRTRGTKHWPWFASSSPNTHVSMQELLLVRHQYVLVCFSSL